MTGPDQVNRIRLGLFKDQRWPPLKVLNTGSRLTLMSGVRAAGSHDDLQQDKKHNTTLLDGIQPSEINIDNILHKGSIG